MSSVKSKGSSDHWLVYWRKEEIRRAAADDRLLRHAASEQFGRVHVDDTLWIVGRGTTSKLVMIGPIVVDRVVGLDEARRRLGDEPFDRRFHAMADPSTGVRCREISLDAIAGRLRFASKNRPSLNLDRPLGLQLQTIRQLTSESAQLLSRVWGDELTVVQRKLTEVQAALDKLSNLDEEISILHRREQTLLRDHLFGASVAGTCAICGAEIPVEFLVAAHIKPRARCSDAERRDLSNVVPMCLFGCDAMFERGWLFIDEGKVRFRAGRELALPTKTLFESISRQILPTWKPDRMPYFRWHAAQIQD
jgi:hypothetical protein